MSKIYESIDELIGKTPLANASDYAASNNLSATI